MLPLDRTTHRGRLFCGAVISVGHQLHRLKQITAGIGDRRYARGIEPPAILQFVLRIKAEEIGRALGAVDARDVLCFVNNIGNVKALRRRETPSYCRTSPRDKPQYRSA